jgi:2-C-methyl-D-erythritol 2,4-cyclodiphosphate synthase
VYRIGNGFDVHRFSPERRLVLGGVEIPYDQGLEGYSDADVLAHALMDALLGAAGRDDIGVLFPPGDPAWRDADSMDLLRQVCEMVRDGGYRIVNVDCVLLLEEPRIAPYRQSMRQRLAEAMEIESELVGVRATTTEGLGFTGRGEGIAALAVALLAKEDGR